MTIPRKQDVVRFSVRVTPKLHAELVAAAKYNGRTLNEEIVERARAAPLLDLLADMARENAEMKAMIKEMHDLARGK